MSSISGETKLLGLLGHNTSYTLSPAIHNTAIKLLHVDQVYVNFDLPEDSVSSFLNVFWAMGGVGLNVTKPYKTLVASLLKSELTSINTLSRGPAGWLAHSTDGLGFDRGLSRLDVEAGMFAHIVFMGGGGAVQAIAGYISSLKEKALKKVSVLRRSPKTDSYFRKLIEPSVEVNFLDWSTEALRQAVLEGESSKTLLVQGTNAPSRGEPLTEFVSALADYAGAFVDLVYDSPSALYFDTLSRGLKSQDGLAMLIEQARLSEDIWWGKSASYEDLARAIKNTGRFYRG